MMFVGPAALSRLLLTCLLGVCACVQAQAFDPSILAKAQGTYRFDDSTCVTGGRMDEGGIRLLYMDVRENRLTLLAQLEEGKLRMLVPPGSEMHADPEGRTLTVTDADGQTRTATRAHRPEARDVHFRSGDLVLAGTLYTPSAAAEKSPGVVLAHGSGPANRFGGTWITFFTDLGFAVLAYDKRGVGASEGDWRQANYVELAADLQAAVDWLSSQSGVDPERVGVHSSSQSGWYAPLAAAGDTRVRFLIQRVGPALWIGPVTAHENESDWRADGVPERDIAPASALWLRLQGLARHGGSVAEAQALIDEAADQPWFEATFGDGWRRVDADAWRRRQVNAKLDPARTAGTLGIPVLWFLAEKDENVPYADSLRALEQADRGDDADITVVTIRNAPHSFLIEQPDGSVRYTDHYWPEMAAWLKAKGFASMGYHACGLADVDSPRKKRD